MPNQQVSQLADWIKTRFTEYKENRKELQKKWERNRKAFQGISEEAWKHKEQTKSWQSDTFIGITKQKVVAAYALLVDMLLQGGKIPFMLEPSPWMRATFRQMTNMAVETVQKSIETMKALIDQQLLDCHADRSFMRNLLSICLYGETYAKAPVHTILRKGWVASGLEDLPNEMLPPELLNWEPTEESVTAPAWDYVSVWNMFRDMETDDLRACAGLIHRQLVSPYWLRKKLGEPYYIDENIKAALKDVPQDKKVDTDIDEESLPPVLRGIKHRENCIQYLEFWGRVPRNVLEQFEADQKAANGKDYKVPSVSLRDYDHDGDEIEVKICVAGNYVVRHVRTDPEDRPFFYAVCDENLDEIGGKGVADNCEPGQKVLNGAVRTFENNTKLTSALIIGVKQRLALNSEDINKGIQEGVVKIQLDEDAEDIRSVLSQLKLDPVGEAILQLIPMIEKYIDDDSMVPKISQGISAEAKETAYEISQQLEKSGKYVATIIRNQDEGLIEPIITWFYDYNMNDPEVVEGKGNYIIKPLGFTSYQDRYRRLTKIMQWIGFILANPELAAEYKIPDLGEEIGKLLDVDTAQYKKTPEEKEQEALQNAQQGPDPLQQAAIEADIDKKKADADAKRVDAETKLAKTELEIEQAEAAQYTPPPGLLPAEEPVMAP